jgi:hypothetical protein
MLFVDQDNTNSATEASPTTVASLKVVKDFPFPSLTHQPTNTSITTAKMAAEPPMSAVEQKEKLDHFFNDERVPGM